MRVGLWRIPDQKRVKLTTELLRMYELYSPCKVDITAKPVGPPFIHPPIKPRPMGRRSKHMLASLCLFGPLSVGSNISSSGVMNSPRKNLIENQDAATVSSEISMTETTSKGSGEPTMSQEKNANSICGHGKHRKKMKNITTDITKNSKSNGENQTVKKDSPILEKMAFDLKQIEDNLNEQFVNLSNGNLPIEYGTEDLISLKGTCVKNGKDPTVPKHGREKAMDDSIEQNSFNYNGMLMLPLKISCCSADVAAMKQDTNESKTETGGLNLTGCSCHLDDQCEEGSKFNNQTTKVTAIDKKAGLATAAEQLEKSDLKRNIDGNSTGLCNESQVMKSDGTLNIENLGEKSVALKGLCINLCRTIPPEVYGKEKCRLKTGDVEHSGKSGKKSKESKKSKKEARKRKIDKSERDFKSSHDGDRETKVSRSIVPVTSRTVEPICKRESPVLELESDCDLTHNQSDASLSEVLNCDNMSIVKDIVTAGSSEPHDDEIGGVNLGKKTEVTKMKHVGTVKDCTSITKVAVNTSIESAVITKCGITMQEKKSVTAVTSTRRIYSPSKKVK